MATSEIETLEEITTNGATFWLEIIPKMRPPRLVALCEYHA